MFSRLLASQLVVALGTLACMSGSADAQRDYGIGVRRDPSKIPGRVAPPPTTVIIPPICRPTPPVCQPTPPPICRPAPPCHGDRPITLPSTYGVFTTGSGLTVNGSYRTDNLKIGFHLGSDVFTDTGSGCHDRPVYCPDSVVYYSPRVGVYPWRSAYDSVYDANYGYARGQAFNSTYATQAPITFYDQRMIDALAAQLGDEYAARLRAAQEKQEPVRFTSLELGRALLAANRSKDAVEELRTHLKSQPDDARATRVLALALIEAEKLDDAAAVMRSAYRLDPALGRERIDATALGVDTKRLRTMVTSMVAHGHKAQSASAWLTVAALMQAEGRDALAAKMLGRAEKLGLERDVSDSLGAALK